MNGMHADLSGVDPLICNLTHRAVVGDILTRAGQTYGDRIALVDGEHELSYRELEARANAVARGLLGLGIGRGDAVALQIQNRWEFVVTFFACAKAGIVALPLNLALSPEDVAYQLADSGVCAVVAEETLLPVLAKALQEAAGAAVRSVITIGTHSESLAGCPVQDWAVLLDNDTSIVEQIVEDRDILHCLYTSGTTSLPKGVVTSHVAVLIAVMNTALHVGLRPGRAGSVATIVLPMFHVTALDCQLLPTLLTGGTAILRRGFNPDEVLSDIATRQVTHLTLLPAMWAALLEHPRLTETDTSSLQFGIYGMAPMPASRLRAIRAAFPHADVILGSGQTETTPVSQIQWREHQGEKDDSWGPASVTTDARIMGEDGRLLPPGQDGEIVYRTPQLMEGYWNNPQANVTAFAHGWFHGGDVGYLDEEGVIWFTDRTKDIVKTGGENVSSVEVERVVLTHPDILECAVIGVADDRWGEAVTAVVVARPGAVVDVDQLRAHCKDHLAGFKVPKRFVVVDELPKTATGKVKKGDVRDHYRVRG
ncbi:MAG TPA: AMP-binding protein [Mycobacterium sp.]|nr:AMP-binding protein [Mycobacterium sp.]